ncbi:MAG: hypothetical protein Q7N87_01705 [Candidatus Uhrbacteria bacterium]|nr:hypothetical protein [Candidatus Uhrbacteria bacterium]
MKNPKLAHLLTSMRVAKDHIAKLSPTQKSSLEKGWDIEHAYYSSALEGSDLDKKEFEKLAQKVA